MKIGIRGKLFLVSVVLDLALLLQIAVSHEAVMREHMEKAIEVEMVRHTHMAKLLLEKIPGGASIPEMQQLAKQLGATVQERVTILDKRGEVLGDSRLSEATVRRTENHADRPEVRLAWAEGMGSSQRFSRTVNEDMLYTATTFHRKGLDGVVRLAKSWQKVQAALHHQRRTMIIGAVLALALGVFMTGLALEYLTRSFRNLVRRASALSQDISQNPIPIISRDEVGGLAQSFNTIAQMLEQTVLELAEDRTRLHTVLHSMSEGMIALNDKKQIILINTAARQLLDIDQSVVGKTIGEVIPTGELDQFLENPDDETFCTLDLDWIKESNCCLQILGTNMQDNRGCILVFRDVTALRQMNQVQRDFVANVSHELRTPVHVMLINAELLSDHLLDKGSKAAEVAQVLEINARRLSRIISNILYISRLDAKQEPLKRHYQPLLPLVERAITASAEAAASKGISLNCTVAADVHLYADGEILSEVMLFNLLDNAIKYCPERARVTIRTRKMGDGMRLEVEDNGPGIPLESRSRLFERFYRVDINRSRELGGTGLGLAIVHSLGEKMGARVGLEPVLPHGCLFWISLPEKPGTIHRTI